MTSLDDFAPLLGRWDLEGALPGTDATVTGRMTFEPLERGGYIIQRSVMDDPAFPATVAIIGPAAEGGALQQHYFDSRGVARVYAITLVDGVLTIWRDGPDFAQRYVGTVSDDGRTIEGAWEREDDGAMVHDFTLILRRVE